MSYIPDKDVDGDQVAGIVMNGWSQHAGIALSAYKVGKMVYITGAMYYSGATLTAGAQYRMFTLPVGSRPMTTCTFPIFWWFDSANAFNHSGWGYIAPDGHVWVESGKTVTMYSHDFVSFNFAYPIP